MARSLCAIVVIAMVLFGMVSCKKRGGAGDQEGANVPLTSALPKEMPKLDKGNQKALIP